MSSANPSQTSVTRLKGVGPKSAERLARLGIHSIADLLFHLPLRYEDRTCVLPIASLRPGSHAVVRGNVMDSEIRFGKRRSLLVNLSDGSGQICLRFFHFNAAQQAKFAPGKCLSCFGEARRGPNGLEMVHPEFQEVSEGIVADQAQDSLTPIYPTTEGMHQLSWRDLTAKALDWLEQNPDSMADLLPKELIGATKMPGLVEALRTLHRPAPDVAQGLLQAGTHPAQRRLALEELCAYQISMRLLRHQHRRLTAPRLQNAGRLRQALVESLPFRLTSAQQLVLAELEKDLQDNRPMLRLVQGDVGSGKTIVAALAMLSAVESSFQAALMAPTELLAEQHARNLQDWLEPLGVPVALLSGRVKGKARQQVLQEAASAQVQILVGTQALFQDEVQFANLGLVVIDEQHRFGVHQRLALREKGRQGGLVPHQLIMTATPIPRSLAMTAYADLDLSVIDELPPGRTPVRTVAISDERREQVVARVREACLVGRQAYWVCTLIEESELLQCQAAEDTAQALASALPELRIGLVHGRLKAAEKEQVMAAFKTGELHLLVATTVIEVGVDVPNASLMIIENPERLGLSQLHQLRGRVGRGAVESHCVLMYRNPLGQVARERLDVLRETNDGFVIARKDLELRGSGEVLGVRQTGEMQFRVADLLRDQALLDQARRLADLMIQHHPESCQALVRRWLGDKGRYASV